MLTREQATAVADIVRGAAAGLPVEIAGVIPLWGTRPGRLHLVALGDADQVAARAIDVLRTALTAGGPEYALVHTHRDAHPPGLDDLAVTRRLVAASRLIGVPLAGHVVVGPSEVFECLSGDRWALPSSTARRPAA